MCIKKICFYDKSIEIFNYALSNQVTVSFQTSSWQALPLMTVFTNITENKSLENFILSLEKNRLKN